MTEATTVHTDVGAKTEKAYALVIEDDLFFSVRIETTLKKLGYTVEVIGDGEKALAWAERYTPKLVVINFGSGHLVPGDVVKKLKAGRPTGAVLGYVSHKWIPEVRPNAMAAGCDLLVANSALVMRLPQLVSKLAPLDGSAPQLEEAALLAGDEED